MTTKTAETAKKITASAIGILSMGWLVIGAAPSAQADPPRHTPAFGYRAKRNDDHKWDKKDYKKYHKDDHRDNHDRNNHDWNRRRDDHNRDHDNRNHVSFTHRDDHKHH